MQRPEVPADEEQRMAALRAIGLLGVEADERFDAIIRVAQRVLKVPMVAVSLVDDDRQWFAALAGLEVRQTSRDVSFCGHAILEPTEPFLVPDAHDDVRFFDNPLVAGDPKIRFYAGVPVLSSNNQPVGTLCVLDSEPRSLSPEDVVLLQDLASLVQAKVRSLEAGSLEFEVGQRRTAELEARRQERRIAALYAVASAPRHDTNAVLQATLELGRRELNMDFGMLTRIEGSQYIVEEVSPALDAFPVGARLPLAESYCSLPVASDAPVLCDATSRDGRFAHLKQFAVGAYEAYAGVPVRVEDELYGTLVFWQVPARTEPFSQADVDFLALMTQLVASLLERRALIARLTLAREAAERAASAKTTFLATVSHELRTPMNAVLGMNRLVLGTELDATQRELVSDATTAASHLLKLLDDVLDFSRHEAHEVRLEEVPFSFDVVAHNALRAVSPAAHRSGVELICEVADTVPGLLLGDPDRLAQVIRNLVGNALKFTSVGSVHLTIDGAPSEADEPFIATISVRDTGVGIAEEHLNRIFRPFIQKDGSSSREYGGTGLGLAIVDRIVSAMSGSVQVESSVGVGSIFTARVALRTTSAEEPRKTAADALRGRALVVDDHPGVQRVLRHLLERRGLESRAVATLEEARTAVAEAHASGEHFDVVFVDEHVGYGEAWTFCAELEGPQVVLLAASVDRVALEQRVASLPGGRSLYKPVTGPALDAVLLNGSDKQPAEASAPAATLAERHGAVRVLVAEDNPLNRKLISLLLVREGLKVDVVSSGREAVSAAADVDYDAVLMDIQMPGLDGIAASRAIRVAELASGRRTPIIAVTASALAGDRERFLNQGLDGYVAKPIDPAVLVAVLGTVMGQRG